MHCKDIPCFFLQIIAIVITSRLFLSCTCRDRFFFWLPTQAFLQAFQGRLPAEPKKTSLGFENIVLPVRGGRRQNGKKKVPYVVGHIPGSQKIGFAVALKDMIIAV